MFHSPSVGAAQAPKKNEPLGHNSSSAATSSVQARLRVRLPAASYFPFLLLDTTLLLHFLGAGNASRPPTSRQLFSVPALHPGNRHRGDSSPCGQSTMDFESISLAARTQCLLPARTHHASWDTDSFLLVCHLSSHCGSHSC